MSAWGLAQFKKLEYKTVAKQLQYLKALRIVDEGLFDLGDDKKKLWYVIPKTKKKRIEIGLMLVKEKEKIGVRKIDV
jgi:hypothetical protein